MSCGTFSACTCRWSERYRRRATASPVTSTSSASMLDSSAERGLHVGAGRRGVDRGGGLAAEGQRERREAGATDGQGLHLVRATADALLGSHRPEVASCTQAGAGLEQPVAGSGSPGSGSTRRACRSPGGRGRRRRAARNGSRGPGSGGVRWKWALRSLLTAGAASSRAADGHALGRDRCRGRGAGRGRGGGAHGPRGRGAWRRIARDLLPSAFTAASMSSSGAPGSHRPCGARSAAVRRYTAWRRGAAGRDACSLLGAARPWRLTLASALAFSASSHRVALGGCLLLGEPGVEAGLGFGARPWSPRPSTRLGRLGLGVRWGASAGVTEGRGRCRVRSRRRGSLIGRESGAGGGGAGMQRERRERGR